MIRTLKNNFFQTFSLTTIWVTLLLTLFTQPSSFGFPFVWRILAIAGIAGVMFGVVYNLLWNYLTLPASLNIAISAMLNLASGMTVIWLLSPEMFARVMPWTIGMLALSIIGHIIGFYFYAKRQNDREVADLNQLLK